MAAATRIARAATGREQVAFCGYHGWHDWYLSANLANDKNLDGQLLPGLQPVGVPRSLKGTAEPFHYRDGAEFDRIVQSHGSSIAAIIMEPARSQSPDVKFLRHIQETARRIGAVLIFDEVTSGWRETLGGIHLQTPVTPDLAVFAKALSNGYPMAAIIGTSAVMKACQETFLSSTNWTEKIGPTAALATIKRLQKLRPAKHLIALGKTVQKGWEERAKHFGVPVEISGLFPLSHFNFKNDTDLAMKTLFTQTLLDHGFLASASFYASLAHTDAMVSRYLDYVGEAFAAIRDGLAGGDLKQKIRGPLSHAGFKRLT
jgi:glutamate-1-semialdehyde 2,1-aminomutase